MADDSENPLPLASAAEEGGIGKSPETKKIKINSLHDGEPENGGSSDRQSVEVGVEVEQVHLDEFEFLDGATRLAVLQAGMVSLLLASYSH